MGVFICVYFAPKSAGVGMFKFIKEVCEYDNVVFAVTDDLADMLEKLGCPKFSGGKFGQKVPARFQGSRITKQVYGSTQEAADIGARLVGLMGQGDDIQYYIRNAIRQNPQLQMLFRNNPSLAQDILTNPKVLKFLTENPDITDELINDPSSAQKYINQILQMKGLTGFFGF
jgi:hypothetical protein